MRDIACVRVCKGGEEVFSGVQSLRVCRNAEEALFFFFFLSNQSPRSPSNGKC